MKEFTDRLIKPLMILLVAAAFIGALVYAFSRILLAVPEAGSTTLAFLVAAEILGVAAVIAATSRVRAFQKATMLFVGIALIAGGGAAAAIGEREIEAHGGGHGDGPAIAAHNIAFDLTELAIPADEAFTLTFVNDDAAVPHNVAIYADDTLGETLFKGEIFPGVETRDYEVPAIPAGTYFFQCDVHPAMQGTATAGDGHGGGGNGGGGAPAITAKDIQFDLATITLPADEEGELIFVNDDAAIPHNVAIYTDETAAEDLFIGEIFNGVDRRTYTIPAIPSGTYFFRCDIHPSMKGSAIFS